jgi:membrane protein DedA with SNARE-associated domain
VTTFVGLIGALAVLFLIVSVGSTVPVLPTGAAVSATAVLAVQYHALALVVVVGVGAAAAYLGDAVTYAICLAGGEALTRRLKMLRTPLKMAENVRQRLLRRPVATLLVSRLVPGGRIPVLLTAAILKVSWRRFGMANIAACVLWSAVYAAIGLLGHSVFPEPWQGVIAAVLIVLVVTRIASWIRKRREAAADGSPSAEPRHLEQGSVEAGQVEAG